MAITRFKNSSIANKGPKYDNALAGLPYIPIIGTATDGGNGTSVSVAFTGNNVAGAGVTYTALSTPGSITATGAASPITVTGLTSGTEYTFKVRAGNSLGDSAYSGSSNSVTPVTPTSFESIATTTLSSSQTTVTFSSIPSTYQHLHLRILGRSTDANTANYIFLRLNGVNGYTNHQLQGNGTAASAAGATSNTYTEMYFVITGANATSGIYGASMVDIHDYASSTKNKTIRYFGGQDRNGAGILTLGSALATGLGTTAVSSIDMRCDAGDFASGTTFALYGIKA